MIRHLQHIVLMTFFGALLPLSSSLAAEVDNTIYAELLERHVDNGFVDYAGLKQQEARLDAYLDILAAVDPDSLSRSGAFAYYINVYNAWTIKLILMNYPGVESIRDLGSWFKSPWKKEFVKLKKGTVHLDHVEHEILRPTFKDPRIHFAVNCASRSCPPLRGEPYDGERLNQQLNEQTRQFCNDPAFNFLEGDTLHVSSIFDWYEEDFPDNLVDFFLTYADPDLGQRLKERRGDIDIEYLDYDWSLNGR